jgi:hypothetical protein
MTAAVLSAPLRANQQRRDAVPIIDPLTERCRVEIRLDVSVPRPGQRPALALDGGNWHVPMRPLDRPGRRHPAPLLDERDSAAALSLCARSSSVG